MERPKKKEMICSFCKADLNVENYFDEKREFCTQCIHEYNKKEFYNKAIEDMEKYEKFIESNLLLGGR